MGNEWRTDSLDSLIVINPKVKLTKGGLYPFVEMKDIDDTEPFANWSNEKEYKSGGSKFLNGDTLMARITPCLENGKISKYSPKEKTESPAFGSTEFIVLRGKKGVSDSNYVYYFSRYPLFRNYAIGQMTGSSGRQRVPTDAIRKYLTKFPPLSEQRRIAHILGTLDNKIALNRQQNATLEAMAQALFHSWFVDFDPVLDKALAAGHDIPEPLQAKAQRRLALGEKRKPLPPEVAGLFPDRFVFEEEVGWVPEGWEYDTLSNLTTELRRGISPKYTEEGGIRVVNQRCIRGHLIDYKICRRNDLNKRKVDGRLLKVGDVLINSTGVGTLGRMAQVLSLEEDTVVDTHVTVLRSIRERYLPYTFCRALYSKERYVEAMGEGSTGQTELKRTKLGAFPILVPPKSLQEITETKFYGFNQKIIANLAENDNLQSLRDTLLPKLISGELRVPAAESLVEKGI